jgi:hypothetical protein
LGRHPLRQRRSAPGTRRDRHRHSDADADADADAATAALVAAMETELFGVQIRAEASAPTFAWADSS